MKVDLLETPSEDVRLEIVPLIDVIFCILTFFILAAVGLTRQQAIELDLPAAETGEPIPGQVDGAVGDRLYVSIDSLGQTYLDQQPVTLDLLYDVLLQFSQVNPGGLIVLYASRDARYEDVVTVLDLLRSVGGDRVALATLPRDADLGDPEALDPFPEDFEDFPGADPFFPEDEPFPLEPSDPFSDPAPSPQSPFEVPRTPQDPNN